MTASRADTIRRINKLLAPSLDEWNDAPLAEELYGQFIRPLERELAVMRSGSYVFESIIERAFARNLLLLEYARKGVKIEEAARKLLQEARGLLLPWGAYKDGSTINLACSKENVMALKQALDEEVSK